MRRHRKNVEYSRALRRNQTEEEGTLWTVYRNGATGLRFRRQHQIGPWIADLACPARMLVIEVDGGGHGDPDTRARDSRRDEWLRQHGWRVLRFWNFQIWFEFDAVMEVIWAALQAPAQAPHPDPLLASQGEGDI